MARITRLFLVLGITLVLLMRLHLSLSRAFDPDEFSYLHWAWLIARGYLPYRDFFFYILPGFPWILSMVLFLTGDTTIFLIASRIVIFLVYSLSAAYVYRLGGSLLAVLIFLTFPMTIDKTIDIRPDMVMLLFFFASVLVRGTVLSGILFGISFLMFPKIIFSLPSILYIRKARLNKWFAGALVIGLCFFGYLLINNLVPIAYTSIAKDSLAVTTNKSAFSPLLLLTPYPLIYLTRGGPSVPWVVNTALWFLGVIGLLKLITMSRKWGIFWSLFIAGFVLFIALFPSPYAQYFLPLSIAASVLAGLLLRPMKSWSVILMTVLLSFSFFLEYKERVAPNADNREQLQVIRDVLAVTKPNESIYDMVGSFVFRPDAYYICCHPYGEFRDTLSRPIPTLRESLITRQTKFLVMDRIGFVFWQTPQPDLSFLKTNYLPTKYKKIYSLGVLFRCQNGACVPPGATRSTNVFTILVPEKYTVTFEPNWASVTIGGEEIRNGQTLDLASGLHRFLVSPFVTLLRIQLTR